MARTPIHEPVREPIRLTDEELMAKYDQQESGEFAIDPSHPPEGMVYQWLTHEVVGQEQPGHIASFLRNGWKAVPASRHDGYYMARGFDGPITRKGMGLYEHSEEVVAERERYQKLKARQQVRDKEAQMIYAPPGTAPRDAHPKTRPFVRKGYVPMEVDG
ncbi:MAG TPA: hypothetical protein VNH17_03895 [Streptosporangiaceae bacterium]|nr:hypothetical protein [Streptosporangiaceae bacterium]